jgi:hypothetical protein
VRIQRMSKTVITYVNRAITTGAARVVGWLLAAGLLLHRTWPDLSCAATAMAWASSPPATPL